MMYYRSVSAKHLSAPVIVFHPCGHLYLNVLFLIAPLLFWAPASSKYSGFNLIFNLDPWTYPTGF